MDANRTGRILKKTVLSMAGRLIGDRTIVFLLNIIVERVAISAMIRHVSKVKISSVSIVYLKKVDF